MSGRTPIGGGPDLHARCEHRSCTYLRDLIASPCLVCGEALGEGVDYVTTRDGRLHARCEVPR